MWKLLIFLVAVFALGKSDKEQRCLWGDSFLKVKTSNGVVEGILKNSCRTGKQFVGFRGIPYAEPPIGELRFRDPVSKAKWEGIWNATFQRPSCIQSGDDDVNFRLNESEDCLYLNVYTPNINYLKYGLAFPKAVMVFIHPGAFNTGSSSEKVYSPDFLIDQDVLVVTFNYRLGALGFLSLQNEDVPGNAGLKDQNLALKWVKNNIKRFGGDPNRITIFGESAGSASVNYHILSKASEGLFNRAIMQSGTAIAPWAYSDPELALKKALNLAKKIGCNKKEKSEILKCIQKVPTDIIIKHQQNALTLEELFSLRIIAFHPTSEPNVPGAFLTAHPFDLMYSGNFTKVSAIIGSNADEGLLVLPTLEKKDPHGYLVTLLGMDLSRFAPYNFHIKPLTKSAIMVHRQISKFYFNSRIITKASMSNVLELLTDVMFTLPIQLTTSLLANSSVPVYNYFFTYDGGYNLLKAATNMLEVPGACHGDDLGYLFYTPELHTKCGRAPTVSSDETMINKMTKMWANFAKTGDPSIEGELKQSQWTPFTSSKQSYLSIGENLAMSESLKLAQMKFWEDLIMQLIEMNKSSSVKEAIDDLEVLDCSSLIV